MITNCRSKDIIIDLKPWPMAWNMTETVMLRAAGRKLMLMILKAIFAKSL